MKYLFSYTQIVDEKIVSTGKGELEWETKIRTLKDFEDFEKAVCKLVGKEVKVSPPFLVN